jgi:hypothetical protein
MLRRLDTIPQRRLVSRPEQLDRLSPLESDVRRSEPLLGIFDEPSHIFQKSWVNRDRVRVPRGLLAKQSLNKCRYPSTASRKRIKLSVSMFVAGDQD